MLALAHVVPGAVFMLLGPLQLIASLRSRHLALHRWSGRVFVACSLVVASSALALAFARPFGGRSELVATVVFATWFLVALGKAVVHVRRRELARHREWMIRAFAIGLGVVTIRPVVAILSVVTGGGLADVLGPAFWIAFILHALVAEAWVRRGGAATA